MTPTKKWLIGVACAIAALEVVAWIAVAVDSRIT
jgi:hypothetical protein